MRASPLALIAFLAAVSAARPAAADARDEVEAKIASAMESYDAFEYDAARKLLTQALAQAKRAKLAADPLTARVHLALGIVSFAGLQDEDAAKLAFLDAAQIDPTIEIDPAYRTPEMAALLDEARAEVSGDAPPPDDPGETTEPEVDCALITGMSHDLVERGQAGAPLELSALVGLDTPAAKVIAHVRPPNADAYVEVPMKRVGECAYRATVPGKHLSGRTGYYFIAAYDLSGKIVAQRGSDGSPNLIELGPGTGPGPGDDDPEDPLGGSAPGGVVAGGKPPKVFVAVAVGSGGAFATGTTEQAANSVECCGVAPALLHFSPELGYALTPHLALSLQARIGLPIGANIEGHSTAAPAALVRLRWSPKAGGEGVFVSGAVGGGVLRSTIKLLEEVGPGMDTDVVGMGPLLLGAGAGYAKPLGRGSKTRLVAAMQVLAGIPVVDKLGAAPINFGIQGDVSLGVQVGF